MNVIECPVISFVIDSKIGGGISKFEKFVEFLNPFGANKKSRFFSTIKLNDYKKKDFP